MCILLAIRTPSPAGELWVAANRDESLSRPWRGPRLLSAEPRVFGGRDLLGGGSWLAVNLDAAFVVGVTNARLGAPPGDRSRGALVVDLARERTLTEAVALLSELELARYGMFNVVLAAVRDCWLATTAPAAAIPTAEAPVVAVGNDPLTAPGERVIAARERARFLSGPPDRDLAGGLAILLADHEGRDPLCRHGDTYGTVCSTIVTLVGGKVGRYLFAPGPPCTTPFEAVAMPA